eukprot:SAG22_NODE_2014_length_3140_cov_2.829990_4_plen_230_part_00
MGTPTSPLSFLAAGIDPNARDKHGWTALHFVALNGRLNSGKMVELLLAAGADPEATIRMSLNPSRDNSTVLQENPEEFARRHNQHAVADITCIGAHRKRHGIAQQRGGAGGGGGEGGQRMRRPMFTPTELQQTDPSDLELQLLVAQRSDPIDEDFLREIVTAINRKSSSVAITFSFAQPNSFRTCQRWPGPAAARRRGRACTTGARPAAVASACTAARPGRQRCNTRCF